MIRRFVKRLGKSERLRRALGWLVGNYVRLCFAAGNWTVLGDEAAQRMWRDGKPFVLAIWHGRLLMMPLAWRRDCTMSMLTSEHRDGELIKLAVGRFGVETVRGSTRKGGARALRTMISIVRGGGWVGITPDAPRGPYMRASDGAIQVARLAGIPIIPATYSASARLVLNTWDRFMVPLPFCRGVFVWGEPITIARDAKPDEVAAKRRELEDTLNRLGAMADTYCNRAPLEPAPLLAESD